MRVYQPRRVSGLLLLIAFILNLGAVVMYAAGTEYGWVVETPTYHAWERALLMSSYVAAALGTAVLEPALAEAGAAILGRLARHRLSDGRQCRARHGGRHHQWTGAVRLDRRFSAAAVRGRATTWCGGTGESTGASLGRVGGSSLERRLAGDSVDRLARRSVLSDPARHSAAHDQHPADPSGAKIIITCGRDGLTHLGEMNVPDGRVRPGSQCLRRLS